MKRDTPKSDDIDIDAPDALAPVSIAWLGRIWRALILPLGILAAWSAVTDGGLVPHHILPSPGAVIAVGYDFIRGGETAHAYSGSFMVHFWASFQRVLGGFALGASLGVALGVLLGYNRRLAAFIEPTLQLTRSIPGICWLPLALIWFGIGTPASIFLISLGSFYAVFVSTLQGVKYVDPLLIRAALSLGATQGALLHTLVLPAAFPAILSGLRIGLSYSWIYMVLGEFTGVNQGLGATLLQSRETLNTELIIALMVIIGFLGILTDWPMLLIMRKVFRMDVK
jgi:ABC-type nitrate/sulfonate/bicarbonate transport system permease component